MKERNCVGCGKVVFSDAQLCENCEAKYQKRVKQIAKRMP